MPTATLQLEGISSFTEHPDGSVSECTVNQPNVIHTCCGDLVPRHSRPDARSKDLKSLSFYPSGALRSISLDQQVDLRTPIGLFPAELVTFYEDGRLDSVFPLNGQLGFGWSEEEEKQLAETYSFGFSFGTVTAKIIGIRFYDTGEVKSLILWPDEVVALDTPIGTVSARTGLRLHKSGALESFEPARPIDLITPIGKVRAYDVSALTIDADENSVRFDEEGNLTHVATSGDVIVNGPDVGRLRITSRTRLALSTDTPVKLAINISFDGDSTTINTGEESHTLSISQCRFLALPDIDPDGLTACDTGCDTCGVACA
jgi:hypothetical protein